MPWQCKVFGHRYRFGSDGPTMTWTCERGCADGGSKTYESAEQARHFAAAFDTEDRADMGRRAPLFGMFPLRLAHALRRTLRSGAGGSE